MAPAFNQELTAIANLHREIIETMQAIANSDLIDLPEILDTIACGRPIAGGYMLDTGLQTAISRLLMGKEEEYLLPWLGVHHLRYGGDGINVCTSTANNYWIATVNCKSNYGVELVVACFDYAIVVTHMFLDDCGLVLNDFNTSAQEYGNKCLVLN